MRAPSEICRWVDAPCLLDRRSRPAHQLTEIRGISMAILEGKHQKREYDGSAARGTKPSHVLAIVCSGVVLAQLDLFIVNLALPSMSKDLGDARLGDLSWILNAYAIVCAALLVFFGRIADRY